MSFIECFFDADGKMRSSGIIFEKAFCFVCQAGYFTVVARRMKKYMEELFVRSDLNFNISVSFMGKIFASTLVCVIEIICVGCRS